MKKLLNLSAALLALAVLAIALHTGCANTPPITTDFVINPDGTVSGAASTEINEHVSIGGNVTYDPATQHVSGGVTLVFRELPLPETVAALQAAGANRVDPLHFTLSLDDNRDPRDDASLALRAALKDPALAKLQFNP